MSVKPDPSADYPIGSRHRCTYVRVHVCARVLAGPVNQERTDRCFYRSKAPIDIGFTRDATVTAACVGITAAYVRMIGVHITTAAHTHITAVLSVFDHWSEACHYISSQTLECSRMII